MALDLLEKAVELEPSDGYILDSLGWAYYLSNSLNNQYIFEKAVFLPNDPTLNDSRDMAKLEDMKKHNLNGKEF